MSLIAPGTAREDTIRNLMIGTPRPPVIHWYTGGLISGSRGQAGTGEMGQYWDSDSYGSHGNHYVKNRLCDGKVTVMTVTGITVQRGEILG